MAVKDKGSVTLKELKRIEKINGSIRKVSVGINHSGIGRTDPAVYGAILDVNAVKGQKPYTDYHFSDGDGNEPDYFANPKIQASIDGIVSGKRRPAEELDEISIEMAKVATTDIITFIDNGAHRNYQDWKGTSSDNLYETGKLRDSIVGIVTRSNKEIWRGR